MDPGRIGRWIAAPVRAIVSPFTTLIVAATFLLWLSAFVGEKLTGYQMLPELIAPARFTEQQQILEDEIWCGVYDVLINIKASINKSATVEDKLIRTTLNHKREFKVSMCNMVKDMNVLIPPGTARQGVPRRQAWYYKTEFSLEGERKRALAARFREFEKAGYGHRVVGDWLATHYVRPARKRTAGNQTPEEIKGLETTLDPAGEEAGFRFFKPKK